MQYHWPSRNGSIYALTLLTVAAVGSMVLIGAALRSSTSNHSSLVEKMSGNASGVMDASELTLGKILNDPNWAVNAQKGAVFAPITVGDRTYSSTITDADTDTRPTGSTTHYRVSVTSKNGIVQESAEFEIERIKFAYYAYLQSLGLDAYWPLNEPAKSTSANEPEDGRTGTFLDPAAAGASTNDEGGTVPLFAATNDHVVTPYDDDYQDDRQGTVSLWVKLTGTSNVTAYGLFGQRFQDHAMPAISLTCIAGSLSAYLCDAGFFSFSKFAQTNPSTIIPNQWHHVAVTWGPGGLKVYVDGELEASNGTNTDNWDTRDGPLGEQPLLIGASFIPTSGSQPQVGFEGSIARFAILTNQLDASAIAELASIKPDQTRVKLIDNTWARVFE